VELIAVCFQLAFCERDTKCPWAVPAAKRRTHPVHVAPATLVSHQVAAQPHTINIRSNNALHMRSNHARTYDAATLAALLPPHLVDSDLQRH
jgi:hypothetical protein